MDNRSIYHEPDSNMCFPASKNSIVLRLRVSNLDFFDSVCVIYGEKYTFHTKQKSLAMEIKYQDELYSYYEANIELEDVRFVYVFELSIDNQRFYYSEDRITESYDFSYAYYNCFQYPYINDVDIMKKIDWVEHAVFYEIFVERFFEGTWEKDRKYINSKWNELPKQHSFFGGDLKGIYDKLDYLKDLGVTALYLTPIFSSISNHKYDIYDYYKIDSQFGNDKLFSRLVSKAHEMDIRIILDGVFNHTSNLLMQFEDVVKKGKKSKYFDWFIIHDDSVDMKKVNYETFSNCYYHPKFNTSNPEVQKFLLDIGKYYIETFDIDGWRLDVADELSHDFWRTFRKEIKRIKPDCFLVGENWHNSYPFLKGDQFDSIMNYSFTKIMLDYLALDKLDAKKTADKLNSLLMRNTDMVNHMLLNLLDSHDTDRFYTSLRKDKNKLLLALAIQFVFLGVPGLYYGIEIPLEGGYDPDNRRCMNWQAIDYTSEYFKYLKQIIALRKEEVLCSGEIKITSENQILCIKRYDEKEQIILYVNHSKEHIQLNKKEILSFRYEDGLLQPDGFLIERVML